MGKKYIIELEDKPFNKGGDFLYRVKGFNSLVFDMTGVVKLTPYTEPDMEQVRKEGYEKGYETAKHEYEDCTKPVDNGKAYQQGLSDMHEALKKVSGMSTKHVMDILGEDFPSMCMMLNTLSASEIIEKIRQYEQEQEEIKVGDEVDAPFGKAIVVNIDSVAKKIWVMYADGRSGFDFFKNAPTKTGRHFPEIAEVLQKMKEADNG